MEIGFFKKLIDFISKPINTTLLIALFLTSGFIFLFNFLPEDILSRMNLLNFLSEYNFIVFIILVSSFFFLVIQLITMKLKREKDKQFAKFFEEQQENLFTDPDAYKILEYVYSHHPNSARLPIQNQKVKLLKQYGLITMASTQSFIELHEDIGNPMFPFILEPIAEEKMKKRIDF